MPLEPTDKTGGASQNADPALQKDAIASRTPIERPKSARELLMEELDAKIVEQREADDETFYQSGDPRAIQMAAQMRTENDPNTRVDHNGRTIQPRDTVTGQFKEADAGADGDPYPEGNADVERDDAAAVAATRTQVDRGKDPLEEFVVREAGKAPMFKTVIDGKTQLIPLDKARQQLQKHLAADIRLQQATERQKQLDARERNIKATEATLQARARQPVVPVDDASLDKEATELVRSLLSDPEATAASKMAGVLKKIRAATPQIDVGAITKQAVSVAKQEIAAESHEKALATGLTEFTRAYPDIAADPKLFALADRETDAIAAEHPEWDPQTVMLEAGKKTVEWLQSMGLRKPAPKSNGGDPNARRQLNKDRLVPMPQARSARPAATQAAEVDDSPNGALAEIRKARGQPY
jgi:hypothetical protein